MTDEEPFTIQRKWIDKNWERASNVDKIPFIAFVRSGKPTKYILIDEPTMQRVHEEMFINTATCILEKKVHNVVNLIIPQRTISRYIGESKESGFINTLGVMNDGDDILYHVMRIEDFKKIVDMRRDHND
jgi:hypothetical protein